jgi:hypothetical protein
VRLKVGLLDACVEALNEARSNVRALTWESEEPRLCLREQHLRYPCHEAGAHARGECLGQNPHLGGGGARGVPRRLGISRPMPIRFAVLIDAGRSSASAPLSFFEAGCLDLA